MLTKQWSFGDRVVHLDRPEWGVGLVQQVAGDSMDGKPCQRLTIRFERAGIKTLLSAIAQLIPAEDAPALHHMSSPSGGTGPTGSNGPMNGYGHDDALKAAMSGPSIKDVMLKLPDAATDPFTTPKARLQAVVNLYRFSEHGGSILDWAAMQSGMKDPMSRFSRHELEDLFKRWAQIRDEHFKKTIIEFKRNEPAMLSDVMNAAPRSAQQAMKRIEGRR